MILKQKDCLDDQLRSLELAIHSSRQGAERQRFEKDLAQVRAGLKGEQEAAYHIDFHLKDSQNWAVIHDLRIEWNGRVAQIDHLLIDRFLDIYVVESKSFRTKIRHENGGWERLNFHHWEGIPCPIEQNQRHITVLGQLIQDINLAPTRLGVAISPRFYNVVVVQPSCSIVGKMPADTRIYRMDKLVTKVRGADLTPLDMWKVVSPETLQAFAAGLVKHHRPAPKQMIAPPTATPLPALTNGNGTQKCQGCGGPLTMAEANYCRTNLARFAGQLLCRKCQGYAPKRDLKTAAQVAGTDGNGSDVVARCATCGTGVDKKVVAFCRFNSKRFAGRVLCRTCQVSG